jgi:hypothetical protein
VAQTVAHAHAQIAEQRTVVFPEQNRFASTSPKIKHKYKNSDQRGFLQTNADAMHVEGIAGLAIAYN